MIREEEHLLFIKELGRLFEDFNHCKCEEIRKDILKDIQLLSNVINPDHELSFRSIV
ncbi:hypothetical protein [Heyndrickxia vini]|uniref:Uncharacterized protein n=1 Tax=Heyndrickxia vini TaxID=1476025 RepID=A0ABX7DXX4_9BACI|nr:hypothetical protein [Heyndrickxia vini]QQZ08162.1 hypothetical protein I5776_13870 [Heyndrickxia vini]